MRLQHRYVDTSLTPNTRYYYNVTAINGTAESTQVLVGDMSTISERMEENLKIAKALETGTAIFEKF